MYFHPSASGLSPFGTKLKLKMVWAFVRSVSCRTLRGLLDRGLTLLDFRTGMKAKTPTTILIRPCSLSVAAFMIYYIILIIYIYYTNYIYKLI